MMMTMLTPYSMVRVLAYVHDYTPNFLPGRCLGAVHLRRLAEWLGQPRPDLRSARTHRFLAAHLVCGTAAGLLATASGPWSVTLLAGEWLEADGPTQYEMLYQAMTENNAWAQAEAGLGLADLFPPDYRVYLQQQLRRQLAQPPDEAAAVWTAEAWRLALPETLRPVTFFHLAQMGRWSPDGSWQATPLTIGQAAQRGYSLTLMESVLEQAARRPLDAERQQELVAWYRAHDAVQVRPVHLLSVKEPALLDAIMARQRWRAHLGRRLSRRHAVVSTPLLPLLRRWLAAQEIALDAAAPDAAAGEAALDVEQAYLGLQLLVDLGRIIRLPLAAPAGALSRLQGRLADERRADLDQKAALILEGIRQAIRGRDAYFVPEKPVDPDLLAAVRQALAQEQELEIAYQALGEAAPRWRRLEPHYLDETDWGVYLHGYCYLAEANRIFRLDRVHEWRIVDSRGYLR